MKTKIISRTFLCLLILGMAMPGAAFAKEHGHGLHYTATYNGNVLDTSFDPNGDNFPVNVVRGSGKGTFDQSDTVIATEFVPDMTGEVLCESNDDFRLTVGSLPWSEHLLHG